jgi:hypothetical protein
MHTANDGFHSLSVLASLRFRPVEQAVTLKRVPHMGCIGLGVLIMITQNLT